MEIKMTFSKNDVEKVKKIVACMSNHKIVIERCERNINRKSIDISHSTIWKRQIGCLLTTRQKSGKGTAVDNFLNSYSPLLSLCQCEKEKDIARMAESEISRFGGIRFTKKLPEYIAHNFDLLSDNEWNNLDNLLLPLRNIPQPKETERICVNGIDKLLKGFGPKQSRNFLQWLGLTQHEIPIDSRIIKWLRGTETSGSLELLSSAALSETKYYCCILDSIQEICEKAEVLPCIFDASVFASFEQF